MVKEGGGGAGRDWIRKRTKEVRWWREDLLIRRKRRNRWRGEAGDGGESAEDVREGAKG